MMNIRDTLWKGIPYERRKHMDSHLERMIRELSYLSEKNNMMLRKAIKLGWTTNVLKIVFVLSIFNHYIIGPLITSSKRFSKGGIENVKSISHGSMSLNDTTAISIMDACTEFQNITNALDISLNMLHSISARDIIYYISKEDEHENN